MNLLNMMKSGKYITTIENAISVMGRENVITKDDVNSLALHVDERALKIPVKFKDLDRYILFPGVTVNIVDMMYKFSGLICDKNEPLNFNCRSVLEDRDNSWINSMNKRIRPGWYLMMKHPEKSKFAYKTRVEQERLLRHPQQWGMATESIFATIMAKVIHDADILTDYTHTKDVVFPNEGRFNVMIRNFVAYENVNRGNIVITYNDDLHCHRNTVISIICKVSA